MEVDDAPIERATSLTRTDGRQQAQLIAESFLSPRYARLRASSRQGGPVLGSVGSTCPIFAAQVVLVCCMLGAIVLSFHIDKSDLMKWLAWARTRRHEGRALFILAYVASLMLLLPGSILALLAGAYFGLEWGVFLVYLGNLIGQTVSFLVARYLFRQPIQKRISARWRHFDLIDTAIQREGAKLIFVLRLNPCIPYNILNYALGITAVPFFDYFWSSAIAIVPFVVASVYMGCLSNDVLELLEGGWSANGAMLLWLAASVVLLCGTLVYGFFVTRQSLTNALEVALSP